MNSTIPSVFDEMEQYKPMHRASVGQRFINYIIDLVALIFINMILGNVFDLIRITNGGDILASENPWLNTFYNYLLGEIIMLIYYFLSEANSGGRTLGKLVTGTRAVKADGSPVTQKDAFMRSLIRLVPFEFISALSGYPWHDKWSDTLVVKTRGTSNIS